MFSAGSKLSMWFIGGRVIDCDKYFGVMHQNKLNKATVPYQFWEKMVERGIADLVGKAGEIDPEVFDRVRTLSEIWYLKEEKAISSRKKQITAELPFYLVWKGEVRLCVAPKEYNLIFNIKNFRRACNELLQTGNYEPDKEGIEIIIESIRNGHTLSVKCSRLRLKQDERFNEFAYLPINTSTYKSSSNDYEIGAAKKFYGKEDFEHTMEWINGQGIIETGVRLLNPDYVKSQISEGRAIARLCVATGHPYNYQVFANNAGVISLLNYLHRIQNTIEKPGRDHLRESLTLCLNDPKSTAKLMTDKDYEKMQDVQRHYNALKEKSQ